MSNVIETEGLSASQLPMRRRRILVTLALVVSLAVPIYLAWQLRGPISSGFTDFKAFYRAGQIVASGNGTQLYRGSPLVEAPFVHAPFESLVFVPFSHFSYVHAAWLWWGCNVFVAYWTLYLLLPSIPRVAARPELPLLAMCIFLPLITAEFNGQDSIFTLFLFAICFNSLAGGRAWIAGCALALTLYKPPLAVPMIFLVALTARKRSSLLAGLVGTSTVLFCVSVWILGWSGLHSYQEFLSAYAATAEPYHVADMPNLRGLVNWIFQTHLSPQNLLLLVTLISISVLAVTVWAVYKSRSRAGVEPLQFALLVAATLLVGFHEYIYDLALLFLPILLVWDWSIANKTEMVHRRLLAFSVPFLIFASVLIPREPQIYASAICVFFILIVWELCSEPVFLPAA